MAPLASVEALLAELRAPASGEQVARVRERVSERIAREDAAADPQAGPGAEVAQGTQAAVSSVAGASGHVLTNGQIAVGLAGTLLLGTIGGAGVFRMLGRDARSETPAVVETAPVPVSAAARDQEPAPVTSSSAAAGPAPSASSAESSGDAQEAAVLLVRMRSAVENVPLQALALANEHAQRFPRRNVAEREEVAIRALVQLGRRDQAEARAAQLVRLAPKTRAAMEALLGRTF